MAIRIYTWLRAGVEFDVVKGKGPVIPEPLESNVEHSLKPIEDPDQQLPFIRPIFQGIREEVQGQAAVLGFVGSPWTIMAYAFEGSSVRHLQRTKRLLFESPEVAHSLLSHIADQVASYAVHQVECGADMVQVFDSWAHHLGPSYLAEFSLPYAERIVSRVHEMHPGTPVLYHANGSAGKLPELGSLSADVIGVDWATPLEDARQELGPEQVLQGNVDPSALLCGSSVVFEQAKQCWEAAGRGRHILNIGHGVLQGTPPDAPGYLCDASKALAGSGVA